MFGLLAFTYINNGLAGLYGGGNNDGGRHESSRN